DRCGVGLQDEGVGPTHALGEAHIDLTVGEVVQGGGDDFDAQFLGHRLGQDWVGSTGNENEVFLAVAGDAGHLRWAPTWVGAGGGVLPGGGGGAGLVGGVRRGVGGGGGV